MWSIFDRRKPPVGASGPIRDLTDGERAGLREAWERSYALDSRAHVLPPACAHVWETNGILGVGTCVKCGSTKALESSPNELGPVLDLRDVRRLANYVARNAPSSHTSGFRAAAERVRTAIGTAPNLTDWPSRFDVESSVRVILEEISGATADRGGLDVLDFQKAAERIARLAAEPIHPTVVVAESTTPAGFALHEWITAGPVRLKAPMPEGPSCGGCGHPQVIPSGGGCHGPCETGDGGPTRRCECRVPGGVAVEDEAEPDDRPSISDYAGALNRWSDAEDVERAAQEAIRAFRSAADRPRESAFAKHLDRAHKDASTALSRALEDLLEIRAALEASEGKSMERITADAILQAPRTEVRS